MGILDGKKKHIQVIATGNIREILRHEQAERRRKWFIFLDIILVICILVGIALIYYNQDYKTGLIFIAVGLIIILYFILRKATRRSRNFRNQRNFRRHKRFRRR